ncbi:hypothetical protein NPIL_163051 [Nephila pilipes]|uniref:Uncharacterized protein n=1 Tax=Nephila pilipes TaxID=299642 RepID=A0A8X6QAZ1_NEPPI|nr:hypothetical protein NPIL_163051 [Nephila pilipes]
MNSASCKVQPHLKTTFTATFPPGYSPPSTTGKKLERYKNNVCYVLKELLSSSEIILLSEEKQGSEGVHIEAEIALTTKMSHSWDDKVGSRPVNNPMPEIYWRGVEKGIDPK